MNLIKNKNFYILLSCIFLVNFLFKLIYISWPSLWYDEIISVRDTLLDLGHIKHEAEWDKNPPFYHYLLWFWSKIFGISEFSVRSMSAFFSSLTAVLIFIFVNKITSRTYAIIATLIFTLHPYLYFFAQEARCYSLLIFLITSNLMIVYSLVQRPSLGKAFLLGVLNFLIFYTHYIAGLILFCQFIYLAIVFRKSVSYILIIYITPILLVLLRFTKKQYLVLFFSNEMSKQKSNVPLANIQYLKQSIPPLYVSFFILFLFIVFLTIYLKRKVIDEKLLSDKDFQFKLFVIFSPIICILILYTLGVWTNVFHERYLIFTIPYIIISFFIFSENKLVLVIFATVMLFFEVTNLKFKESKQMDYKFCSVLAKELMKKGDLNILIQTHDVVGLFVYYYDIDLFKSKNREDREFLETKNIYFIDNIDDLKNLHIRYKKPILFLQTYQKKDDNIEIIKYFDDKNCKRYPIKNIEGVNCTYIRPLH